MRPMNVFRLSEHVRFKKWKQLYNGVSVLEDLFVTKGGLINVRIYVLYSILCRCRIV
jgi:hypothetical protein